MRGNRLLRPLLGGFGLVYGLSGPLFGLSAVRLGGPVVLLAVAVATGACYLLVLSRVRPRLDLWLLIGVAVGAAVMHHISPYTGLGFAFTLPWLTVFSVPLRYAIVVGLVDAAGFATVSGLTGSPFAEGMGITFGLLFTVAFAVAIRQLSVVRERTDAAATARAGEAVLAERQRMAREMHDVLAHSLSAQILHLEGAIILMERGDSPGRALDHVRRANRLARAGLVETKQALQALRGDGEHIVARLEALAGEFRAATGAGCEVSTSGDPASLPPPMRLAVVRTAQEALTNVRKHAPGASCAVDVRCGDGWCELEVYNAGIVSAGDGEGYGLVGMRERAELIGGSLAAGPSGDGFRVLLRLPHLASEVA